MIANPSVRRNSVADSDNPALRQIVLRDASANRWMVFSDPVDVLTARELGDVQTVVEEAENRVATGAWIAGFLCYEAAPAFDPAFLTRPPGRLPLASFGVFGPPRAVEHLPPAAGDARSPAWRIEVARGPYRENIEKIRRQIAFGNTYQVNYTIRQHAAEVGDPWTLFRRIAWDAPHAAWVDGGDYAIVSASPELFFDLSGERLVCRPMKGTAARGMTTRQDDEARASLEGSAKDRAENVMIADMVRNDLGRIATPGSVRTRSLYDVEKYRTVWQMTSTIEASTAAPLTEILRALFPSASVTGAPKVASMRLIAGMEQSPRQAYTGCIGFLGPGRQARFNVAIRTALVDRQAGTAVYGVGGGIVWDSDADAEYQECLNKAMVLNTTPDSLAFELLETMMWTRRDGCRLLEEHLARLAGSARYFDFRCDRDRIERDLRAFIEGLGGFAHCIRLLLGRDGTVRLETREPPQEGADSVVRVRLARDPVDPCNPFLYHKTTRRGHYERALAMAGDCDDVLLWNDRGEITESTIANVIVRINDGLYTPPVECGLLDGTLRRSLLAQGKVVERVVRVDELPVIDDLYLVNSVRGWRRAVIDEKSTAEC